LVDGSQLLGRGDLFLKGDRLQSLLPDAADFAKLLTGADLLTPADNSVADTIKPIFDDLSARQHPVSTSAKPKLSAPLSAILEYAQKQDEYVSARKIQSSIRLFRDTTAFEIRSYFQWLADNGFGIVRGDLDNLEFSAK
jgi:hypothetical protein